MRDSNRPSTTESFDSPISFSIVIPAYNAATTIRASIESLLAQSYEAFEIVVIDDCSRDATAQITREYASRDSRVRLIERTTNTGASACRNAGVRAASHHWIGCLDADAAAETDFLARAAAIAREAREAGYDAFGGGCDYFRPTTMFERVTFAFEADDSGRVAETFDAHNPREPPIRGTNFFFTRDCFDKVGGFVEDVRAAEDRLFLCNAIERGCRVRFDPGLRVGHPLPGCSVRNFLRRKNAIERWRLVAAERSPILRQVYRPIWPVITVAAVAGGSAIWLFGLVRAIMLAAAVAGATLVIFAVKGLRRRLPLGGAVQYAVVNVVKKACTVAIYVLGLKPAGRDWKQR